MASLLLRVEYEDQRTSDFPSEPSCQPHKKMLSSRSPRNIQAAFSDATECASISRVVWCAPGDTLLVVQGTSISIRQQCRSHYIKSSISSALHHHIPAVGVVVVQEASSLQSPSVLCTRVSCLPSTLNQHHSASRCTIITHFIAR